MLISLISLTDDQIETVTDAVREWCALNHCAIDSEKGRRAITASVDLVQINASEALLDQLVRALGPFESRPEKFNGISQAIDNARRPTQTCR